MCAAPAAGQWTHCSGSKTRVHSDLDLWLEATQFEQVITVLAQVGVDRLYPWGNDRPWNFVGPTAAGWTVEAVLDEELVERVRGQSSLFGQHLGCCCRWRDSEHRSAFGAELRDCWRECGGLAGSGGADDQDEVRCAGDGGCSLGLCGVQRTGAAGDGFGTVDGRRR